jgi:excisionase family DNA binding protein
VPHYFGARKVVPHWRRVLTKTKDARKGGRRLGRGHTANSTIDDFNTVDHTAKVLKTNRKTIYEAIARKEIPAVRIGRLLRIPGAWLNRAAAMTAPGGAA